MKRRVLSFLLAFSLVAANVSAYSAAPLSAYAGETKEENSGAGDSGTQSEDSRSESSDEVILETSSTKYTDENTHFYFTMNSDGETATVTGIDSSYVDSSNSTFTVPSTVSGLSVTAIGNSAFSSMNNRSNFKKLSLPSTVETIGSSAFYNWNGLTSIEIPESAVTIGSSAFYNCSSVESIKFNEKVETIARQAFNECKALKTLSFPKSVKNIGDRAFYNCNLLTDINFSEGIEAIGNSAFYGCKKLTELELPKSLNSLGESTFYNCEALLSVNLSELTIEEIPSYCFFGSNSLKRAWFSDSITTIGSYAFKNEGSINSIKLGDSVRTIGYNAFYGSAIDSLYIPRSLTSVGSEAFGNTAKLKKVTFEEKIREIPDYFLSGCNGIEEISLPSTITEIGSYAFNNCTNLKKIEMPDSVYYIGDRAFYGCSQLASIELGDELESLGNQTFAECSSLTDIYLSNNITEIPYRCFYKTALREVVCPYNAAKIDSQAFSGISTLKKVTISGYTSGIDSYAFNQESLTICSESGSAAEKYAESKGYEFVAGKKTESLSISDSSDLKLGAGEKEYLSCSFSPADSLDGISWTSMDEDVAKVEIASGDPKEAVITGVSAGETYITVSMGNCTQRRKVNVKDAVTSLSFYTQFYTINSLTSSLKLSPTVRYSGSTSPTLVWESKDESVATVDAEGYVTAVSNGITRITVRDADGYASASCFVKVILPQYATAFSLDKDELLLSGSVRTLNPIVSPADANNYSIRWRSSDTSVATVNSIGQVTGISEGTAMITATLTSGYDSFTASCKVIVSYSDIPVTGITINESSIALNGSGSSRTVTASVLPENADVRDIVWYSADESVAKVDQSGKVTAVAAGKTVITAESREGGYQAECTVKVTQGVDSVSFNNREIYMGIGDSQPVDIDIFPSGADRSELNIYSTNRNIALVENMTIKGLAQGTAYIRCRSTVDGSLLDTCKVYVGIAAPTADETENTENTADTASDNGVKAVICKKQKLNIRSYFKTDNISGFSSDNKKTAAVNKKGILKGKKAGEVTINAYVKTNGKKEIVESHTFKVEIAKLSNMNASMENEKISISENLSGISDLKPTAYEIKNKKVANVDENGIITAKASGSTRVIVYFGEGKNAAKVKAKLKVKF